MAGKDMAGKDMAGKDIAVRKYVVRLGAEEGHRGPWLLRASFSQCISFTG
jgi:hypothetical protein